MRIIGGSKALLFGIIGVILGGAAETLINRMAGTVVVTDGILWGAVVALFLVSIPNFARMGSLTLGSDRPAVNLVVGIALFISISLLLILVFFGIFCLIGRFLP